MAISIAKNRKWEEEFQVTYPRFEPVNELDNVRMLQPLQHVEFVVDHLLVSLDILLQDDLDGDFARRPFGLPYDAIGTSAECATESIS